MLVAVIVASMIVSSWAQVILLVDNFVQLPSPCTGINPNPFCWLKRPAPGNLNSTHQYYVGIGAGIIDANSNFQATDTFRAFKIRNGFNTGSDVQAVYFNEGDLRLGRDMHCKENGAKIACYVSNYGPPPLVNGQPNPHWPNAQVALAETINRVHGVVTPGQPFATVAMEYSPTPAEKTVTVREFDGATPNTRPSSDCPFVGSIIERIPGVDVDTGIDIEAGDIVTFSASGSIWAGLCLIGNTGPNGYGNPEPKYPFPSATGFSVIGRVGTGGYFFIGDGSGGPLSSKTSGRLFLRTNDDIPGNGNGSFSVKISVNRQNVKFYIYDKEDTNLPEEKRELVQSVAALDQERKAGSSNVYGLSWRNIRLHKQPCDWCVISSIDLSNFIFSSENPNYIRSAQEEKFRELNRLVKLTNPNPLNPNKPIEEMIDWMYGLQINQKDKLADDELPVPGWFGHKELYNEIIRPYCRTCHVAQRQNLEFASYEQFKSNPNLNYLLCQTGEMPHAQVPYDRFKLRRLSDTVARDFVPFS